MAAIEADSGRTLNQPIPLGVSNQVRNEIISRVSTGVMRAFSINMAGDLERRVKEGMLRSFNKKSREPIIEGVIQQNLMVHGAFEILSRAFMPEIKTYGKEHLATIREAIKERKNILFVARHASHVDHSAIDFSLRRSGFTDLAEKLTFIQGIKMMQVASIGEFFSHAYSRINVWPPTVPVVTDFERAAREKMNSAALLASRRAFENGRIIVIYPEGERSKTGGLIKPKTPIGHWIPDPENTLILPVALDRTEDILPPYDFKLRAAIPTVTFCEPIDAATMFGEHVPGSRIAKGGRAIHTIFTKIAEALPESKRGYYKDKVNTLE